MALKGYVIELSMKHDEEYSVHIVNKVFNYLNARCWVRKAAHMRRAMKYIVVTPWEEKLLVQRLQPVIEEVGGVEEFWVYAAPRTASSGSAGNIDPFRSALVEMGEELRHPTYFKNMRDTKRLADRAFGSEHNRDPRTRR